VEHAQGTDDEERLGIVMFAKIGVECNGLECLTIGQKATRADGCDRHLLFLRGAWTEASVRKC
jgi:hypothetical protein